jgi:hypothetical protein
MEAARNVRLGMLLCMCVSEKHNSTSTVLRPRKPQTISTEDDGQRPKKYHNLLWISAPKASFGHILKVKLALYLRILKFVSKFFLFHKISHHFKLLDKASPKLVNHPTPLIMYSCM